MISRSEYKEHFIIKGGFVVSTILDFETIMTRDIDLAYNTTIYNDEEINVYTYQLENIITEKFETTLDRGEFNGRIRDLFDIYFLFTQSSYLIDKSILRILIIAVSEDRGTLENLEMYSLIKNNLINSSIFNQNFIKYRNIQYPDSYLNLTDIMIVFDTIYELIKEK